MTNLRSKGTVDMTIRAFVASGDEWVQSGNRTSVAKPLRISGAQQLLNRLRQRRPIRHCEEPLRRSNPGATACAAPAARTVVPAPGLLRCARNDGQGIGSLIS